MLLAERFFGGSSYIEQGSPAAGDTQFLGTIESRYTRVITGVGASSNALNLHTAAGLAFTEGGPIYIISNGSDQEITLKTRGSVTIGTIASGATGFVFLLDRYANLGDGDWEVAGQGTAGSVGDQGDPTGFNYGTATLVNGIGLDLGTETPNELEEGVPALTFGSANAIPVSPSVPL